MTRTFFALLILRKRSHIGNSHLVSYLHNQILLTFRQFQDQFIPISPDVLQSLHNEVVPSNGN